MGTMISRRVSDDFVDDSVDAATEFAHRQLIAELPTAWQAVLASERLIQRGCSVDWQMALDAVRAYRAESLPDETPEFVAALNDVAQRVEIRALAAIERRVRTAERVVSLDVAPGAV